jgi:hypothetical protein
MADGVNNCLKGFDQYEVLLGDELRGERATIGKSLLDVQRDLKIKASYIAAIENCDLNVFFNKGFIAGYVRSYARYLELNPDIVFERFCRESGFSSSNKGLTLEWRKSLDSTPKDFGLGSNWQPGTIGQIESNHRAIKEILSRSAPVMLVLVVLFGTCFGAVSVLKQVQKLDVVALEEIPEIFTSSPQGFSDDSLTEEGTNIYSSEELRLPVFEPRDKAVSMLKPSLLTALEDKKVELPLKYFLSQNDYSKLGRERSFEVRNNPNKQSLEPVLRTAPVVPVVKLLAMTPAWVRIKNQDGDVIFEKIMKQRETYTVEKDLFNGMLRAGNAQNVYFLIDKQIFGPLSNDKSVVKGVSLDPITIQSKLIISAAVTEKFWSENKDTVFLNTAEVVD